jgi:signal transduction histidine kinase
MRERVSAAGGTFEAGASDGTWVVRAEIPAPVPA